MSVRVTDPARENGADPRRRVPRTDAVMADPRLAAMAERVGSAMVLTAVRAAQDRARRGDIPPEKVAEVAAASVPEAATSLRRTINATGVLLHTNLGRAPLSAAAVEALRVAAGCTDVEFDLATGDRARRGRGALAALAGAVPAAGGVHVVNNTAAALALTATTLAAGKEVVLSRGEFVEIGDGFRLSDLIESAGARIREVGTTNRTTRADYARAVGPDTGFVLKVHPSNFRITGFTGTPGTAELADLGVPLVVDIGSGLLAPEPLLPEEPDADTALRQGASLVTASGDKLLGGPQAGLLLGDHELVERIRRHPLARAMRVDKLTLAALEATLRGPATPTAAALHAKPGQLRERAERLSVQLRQSGVDAVVVDSRAVVGGGGAPGVELPSHAVSVPAGLAVPLRKGRIAVVGRLDGVRLLLDLRSVPADLDDTLLAAVAAAGRV